MSNNYYFGTSAAKSAVQKVRATVAVAGNTNAITSTKRGLIPLLALMFLFAVNVAYAQADKDAVLEQMGFNMSLPGDLEKPTNPFGDGIANLNPFHELFVMQTYYTGNLASMFGTGMVSGVNLFRLDGFTPALTANETPYTYSSTTAATSVVEAAFPPGMTVSNVATNPITASNVLIDNIVTFAGIYNHDNITLNVTGTVGYGRIPVSFATSEFGINVNTPPAFAVSLNPAADKDFGSQEEGYEEQTPHSVTITNTGIFATGELVIGLSGANINAFALSTSSIDNIEVGASDNFTVAPAEGLSPGTYRATVTVTGAYMQQQSFNVSFEVTGETSINNPRLTPENTLITWAQNGFLHVSGVKAGETVSIYSITGALVYSGVAVSGKITVPLKVKGVYVVQAGERTVKAVLN